MDEPIARGVVVPRPARHPAAVEALAKEAAATLRALRCDASVGARVEALDFALLVIEDGWDPGGLELPDLTNRAAAVLSVSRDETEGRAASLAARKALRARGAALGARGLVLGPDRFGVLGLESDGDRERLQILLQALALDAERLRLRREGWEDPPV